MAVDVGLRLGPSSPLELSDPLLVGEEYFNKTCLFFFFFLENADAWKSKPFVETQCFK